MNPVEISTKIAEHAEGKSDRYLLICIIVVAFLFLVSLVIRMERIILAQMKESREQTKELIKLETLNNEIVKANSAILDRTERALRQNYTALKNFTASSGGKGREEGI